jgi:hypothetical protein
MRASSCLFASLLLIACGDDGASPDATPADAGSPDGEIADGPVAPDAPATPDAPASPDANTPDGGSPDAPAGTVALTVGVTGSAAAATVDLVYLDAQSNPQPCVGGCTLHVTPGTRVTLQASTVSTFVGWGAPCSGTDTCQITVGADTSVSARFDRDPDERWTVLVGFPATSVAFAPDGDVVVAGPTRVARYSADGATVRWNVALPGPASRQQVAGLDVAPDGSVFALVGGGPEQTPSAVLSKLTAAGAVAWSRTLGGVVVGDQLAYPRQIAATPGGDVAVATRTASARTVAVYDGDGTDSTPPLWSRDIASPNAVAVDAQGVVHVAVASDDPPGVPGAEIVRFSSTGTALTSLGVLPGQYDASFDVAAGHVIGGTSGFSSVTVSRDFQVLLREPKLGAGTFPQGVAADDQGHAVALRAGVDDFITGMVLRRFLPGGTWTIEKVANTFVGVTPHGLDAHSNGDIAVVGSWVGWRTSGTWLRVYARPATP